MKKNMLIKTPGNRSLTPCVINAVNILGHYVDPETITEPAKGFISACLLVASIYLTIVM